MRTRFYRTPDGQAGIFFTAFGAFIGWQALQYPLGRASQMGPGFFPFAIGVLLVVVGLVVSINAIRSNAEEVDTFEWRSAVVVTLSILASGLLLLSAGLFVAIPVLVLVASLAARNSTLVGIILSALVLTFMAWLLFIVGLDLRIPLIGS